MACPCCNCETYTLTCDGVETTSSLNCDPDCLRTASGYSTSYPYPPYDTFTGPYTQADLDAILCGFVENGAYRMEVVSNEQDNVVLTGYCCEQDLPDPLPQVLLPDSGTVAFFGICTGGCTDCGSPPP